MSETVKATIEWRYLPELPPEPEEGYDEYLVAARMYCGDEVKETCTRSWWGGGDINWIINGLEPLGIYAWAAWPEAPPVKAQ